MHWFNAGAVRRWLPFILFWFCFVAVFITGVLVGSWVWQRQQQLNLTQFWHVYALIKDRYIEEPDPQKAVQGATQGLVNSLDDPYSAFLPPSEKASLDEELKGEFEGIGAELTEKNRLITVVAPLSNSPAEAAGLKPKDVIVKVDDLSTQGLSLSQVVAKIRGPKGTVVRLTIMRESQSEPFELKITRANIKVRSVTTRTIGQVAYLAISQFGDDTVKLARQEVQNIAAQKPKALIVDLRNNPGGYLSAVAPIAGLFLPPSEIVVERYRSGRMEVINSTDVPIFAEVPLFVLINGGSASASEILAGALQDYKRATLVGQKTFGKGSVQDIIPLSNDSALRLTIAEWLTPKRRAINKVGIEPDVVVEGEKTEAQDPIFDKALELAQQAVR